ncbi:MAG TPA: ATP-binding protein, partial [Pirellulales bacterium]|nr:ATP-binding protein [Pirellulales bacterium]
APYRAAVEGSRAQMASLKRLTADNPLQQERLAEVQRSIQARLDFLEQTRELAAKEGVEALRNSRLSEEGERAMARVRDQIAGMTEIEHELLKQRSVESENKVSQALATVVIATLLGLVLTLAGFTLLRRYLQSQRAAAEQLQAAHDELESRVRDRTADLGSMNRSLEAEVAARQRIAEQLGLAHHELQFSNARLNALLEGTSDQVAALDPEGRFIMSNRAYAYEFLPSAGPAPELGLCLADEQAADAAAHQRKLTLWRRALAGEQFTVIENFGLEGDQQRYFEVTFSSIRDPQGQFIGASYIGRDVTRRVLAERQLEAFAERLKRSNRELEEFASVASHDLQEPLRKIQAFGDRLGTKFAGQLGEQGNDYLNRMLQAAGRMRTLINDLLTFSRISTRATPFVDVDLNQATSEVLLDLEERVRQTGGQVIVGQLPIIQADALQMRQLLQNLIGNALKFHPPDRPPVVRVEARELDSPADDLAEPACQLVVSDNGIGFDIKYIDRIFNVFQRLHAKTEYEGTGMGLAICRKIVERHHGSIAAVSRPGEGASFIITLPLKQTDRGDQRGEAA